MELPDFLITPKQLILDKEIQPLDCQVYGVIYWYKHLKLQKCIVSNENMASLLQASKNGVSKSVSSLVKKGYVKSVYDRKTHTRELIPLISFGGTGSIPNGIGQYPKRDVGSIPNDVHNNIDIIREVNKNVISKDITVKPYGNDDINDVCSYFLQTMKIPKEDCSQKQSRQYWNLLLKESKTGKMGVKWLIDIASKDVFYKNNITSSKSLYYTRVKIIARQRGGGGYGSKRGIDATNI